MAWQFSPYFLPLITSVALPGGLALLVLRRRHAAGARAFIGLMAAVAGWSIVYLVELTVADVSVEMTWHQWAYVVGDLMPPAWLIFAADYAGGRGRRFLSGHRLWWLAIVPVISATLIATGHSSLIWTRLWQDSSAAFSAIRGDPGPWYWIDLGLSYAVFVLGVAMLTQSLFRSRRLYRQQIGILFIGIIVPWVADLATSLGFGPLPDLDLTPMACTATAVVMAWGFLRFHFMDVMPVARDLVFERLGDPVVILDHLNRVVDLNAAAVAVLGAAGAAAAGKFAPDVLVGWPDVVYALPQGEEARAEMTLGESSEQRFFDLRVTPLRRGNGSSAGRLIVLRDITERKLLERRLAQQAFQDALTGLANRAHFHERLASVLALESGQRRQTGVLFLDLDDFKTVNDSLGHPAGDRLLVEVARRLEACLPPRATAARLGGDEFALLLPELLSVQQAVEVAQRVLRALETPLLLAGRQLQIRASIGIATAGPAGPETAAPEDLLRNADLALYAAKANGKAHFAVFDASMKRTALERLELESAMRQALDRGEFRVYYQPIFALADGRMVEVEALVRWQHPERGLVSPAAFIPLAEETGLIVPLGQLVLETACRQVREWQARYPNARGLAVAVNLSGRQFQHPRLFDDIDRTLRETGLAPQYLKLEITESLAMQQADSTTTLLDRLKARGVQLAIDDFGTGYSSLSHLKRFPVDTLKIDRSFVDGLGDGGQDTAIVRMIVALAKSLGVGVTAEGIETETQHRYLRGLGAQHGQGFLFSKPLPAHELEARLAADDALPLAA